MDSVTLSSPHTRFPMAARYMCRCHPFARFHFSESLFDSGAVNRPGKFMGVSGSGVEPFTADDEVICSPGCHWTDGDSGADGAWTS